MLDVWIVNTSKIEDLQLDVSKRFGTSVFYEYLDRASEVFLAQVVPVPVYVICIDDLTGQSMANLSGMTGSRPATVAARYTTAPI